MIACYGGTFDPPHNGHIEAARDVLERTGAVAVRLIPCRMPPHRGQPQAAPEHRLRMTALAVADIPGLQVDAREMHRDGPSYTVDTLVSIRQEVGPWAPLAWVIGSDALAGLESWSRWQQLPELAHLLVLDRPGAKLPAQGPVAELLQSREVADTALLHARPAGCVLHVQQRRFAVSASEVRAMLERGASVDHLLPAPVWAYIREQRLYGEIPGHNAESE